MSDVVVAVAEVVLDFIALGSAAISMCSGRVISRDLSVDDVKVEILTMAVALYELVNW